MDHDFDHDPHFYHPEDGMEVEDDIPLDMLDDEKDMMDLDDEDLHDLHHESWGDHDDG